MKKYIAFITALVSAAALMTACGKDDDSSSEKAATTAASTTSSVIEVKTTEAGSTEASTEAKTTEEKTTEEKTTEEKTTEEDASDSGEPDTDYDFAGLAGYWYIDGDPTTASIHIFPDGSFESFYATGTSENRGVIKREFAEDLNNYFFILYDEKNEPIMSFADDGEAEKSDIYMGESGTPHFVKLFGEGGLGDDGRAPGEEFIGEWQCDRATITVSAKENNMYDVSIVWGDGVNSHYTWEYLCSVSDGKLHCEGTGQKVHIWKLDDTDAAPDFKIEYSNGSADFEYSGNAIVWKDYTEDRGNGMMFRQIPE